MKKLLLLLLLPIASMAQTTKINIFTQTKAQTNSSYPYDTSSNGLIYNVGAKIRGLQPDSNGQYVISRNDSIVWDAIPSAGAGTVTSVGLTVPSVFSVSGSPVTTSGTLGITYSGTPLPIANGGTGSINPSLVQGSNVTITGTWPNQTISSSAGGTGTVTSVGLTNVYGMTIGSTPVTTSGNITIKADTTLLTTRLYTKKVVDSLGALIGSGSTGTVTSVGLTNAYGLTITGSPITTSGTMTAKVDTTKTVTWYQLYKAIDSLAAISGTTNNLLQATSIYSLKSSGTPGNNYYVGSFSGNSTLGGGMFTWIVGNANAVTEILGLNCKSNATTAGYWVRSNSSAITPEDLGADHTGQTLVAAGVSANANAYWATAFNFMGRTLNVNTVTMDFVGIQMMMYLIDVNGRQGTCRGATTGTPYYFNGDQGIRLPFRTIISNRRPLIAIENINVAFTGTWKDWAFRDSNFLAADDANQSTRLFSIRNLSINMQASTRAAGARGIRICASNNSLFEMINVYDADTGIMIRHCEVGLVLKCNTWTSHACGIYVGPAYWDTSYDGAAQSNATPITSCRAQMGGYANEVGVYCQGSDGCVVRDLTVEGFGDGTGYGIVFDNQTSGGGAVRSFTLDACHFEMGYIAVPAGQTFRSCVLFKVNKSTNCFVNNCYDQAEVTRAYIEVDAIEGNNYVFVSNLNFSAHIPVFAQRKTGAGDIYWNFKNNYGYLVNSAPVIYSSDNTQSWYLGTGYTKPIYANSAAWSTQINGDPKWAVLPSTNMLNQPRAWEQRGTNTY